MGLTSLPTITSVRNDSNLWRNWDWIHFENTSKATHSANKTGTVSCHSAQCRNLSKRRHSPLAIATDNVRDDTKLWRKWDGVNDELATTGNVYERWVKFKAIEKHWKDAIEKIEKRLKQLTTIDAKRWRLRHLKMPAQLMGLPETKSKDFYKYRDNNRSPVKRKTTD